MAVHECACVIYNSERGGEGGQVKYADGHCANVSHYVKGTVSRDFQPLVFFTNQTPPRALTHRLKPFRIWLRIRRNNRYYSSFSGVNDKCQMSNRFWRLSKRLSRRIRSHIRNGFSLLIRDLYGVD
jgi:hypothetical protein